MPSDSFLADIKKFNQMYNLASHDDPHLHGQARLENFLEILKEEVDEADDIIAKLGKLDALEAASGDQPSADIKQQRVEALTDLSDWLGDLIVYCASEARRWGIPLGDVLDVIMASNFSKLGADGEPIYDHRGKVQKGPNYWAPEAKISDLLERRIGGATRESVGESLGEDVGVGQPAGVTGVRADKPGAKL